MKRIASMLVTVCALLIFPSSCHAGGIRITREQLPEPAVTMLDKYFPSEQISYIIKDNDIVKVEYEVRFMTGKEVEFNGKGEWKTVDTKPLEVPSELVPAEIMTSVAGSFPNTAVVKISRKPYKWEIELNNGLEIEFSKDFRVIEIDD